MTSRHFFKLSNIETIVSKVIKKPEIFKKDHIFINDKVNR